MGPNEVGICDVDALKIIYSARHTFLKPIWYRHLTPLGHESLFSTSNVEFHKRHRRLLGAPLSETSIRAYRPLVDSRCKLAIQKAREEMRSKGAADMYKWWLLFATDVIAELSFGESFNTLEHGEKNEYIRMLEEAGRHGFVRATLPLLISISDKVPLPYFSKSLEHAVTATRYAAEALSQYKKAVEATPEVAHQTLFANLLKAKDADTLTFEEMRNDAELYIIAGSDTAASTLTYLVLAVCRHPPVRSALLKELQLLSDDFDDQDLNNLPYLGQVINEVLRLYPAAPASLPRQVPAGGAELCDYTLDEGVLVCAQAYSTNKDPDIFPEPLSFDPSRWASPTQAMKDAFMSFGKGARVCIGLHLAHLEIRLATARFFLAFPDATMASVDGMTDEDMEQSNQFMLSPKGGRCLMFSAVGASA
ncbi:hypothetical protein JDV02_006697 [Purpureocillium takamizusanense]|uniref:Cytochrome P450 n=1 Tax=Purpureocillium takamizusanense TaxID=2060973 RepID=A0A9Q8VDA2_9HYPO|nr:uncharacterized protein JDV02_006697 [Purpureocillium takamizusanense]UNI20627.1 hypothetical protein JDV02_006697 [Purpureocillium takamizusanense]